MRKVVITFDDGRVDNFKYAFPILQKYGLKATFFITTGYVDGSFCPATWRSSEGPMSIDQLNEMKIQGNEIALHGDCHKTEIEDFEKCYEKMTQWTGESGKYGFSIPGSHYDVKYLERFIEEEKDKLLYVRGGSLGRGKNKTVRKIFKGFRVYTGSKSYFSFYNSHNILSSTIDKGVIPSIGIRDNDKVDKIKYLLKKMPDEHSVIFMFHSILPSDSPHLSQDPWCWSAEKFDAFCQYLSKNIDDEKVRVITMKELIQESV